MAEQGKTSSRRKKDSSVAVGGAQEGFRLQSAGVPLVGGKKLASVGGFCSCIRTLEARARATYRETVCWPN